MRAVRVLIALFLLIGFAWGMTLLTVSLFSRRDEARPVDVIVVLGAAQYDGRPSPVLRARLDHAIDLYTRGIAPNLIVTGGIGVGDTVSEGEVGRRYAVRNGVPAANIHVEGSGLSTAESMAAVADLMREHGMESAVLVSDPFHMLRLRVLARLQGLRAYSSPTRTSPIVAESREEWRHVLRESLIIPVAVMEAL